MTIEAIIEDISSSGAIDGMAPKKPRKKRAKLLRETQFNLRMSIDEAIMFEAVVDFLDGEERRDCSHRGKSKILRKLIEDKYRQILSIASATDNTCLEAAE